MDAWVRPHSRRRSMLPLEFPQARDVTTDDREARGGRPAENATDEPPGRGADGGNPAPVPAGGANGPALPLNRGGARDPAGTVWQGGAFRSDPWVVAPAGEPLPD